MPCAMPVRSAAPVFAVHAAPIDLTSCQCTGGTCAVLEAGNGARISDGVDQQAVPASRVFPYLAPPDLNPPPPMQLSLNKSK